MIAGRWFVTPHAVRRYQERHRPDASRVQALAELALWSEVAEMSGHTRDGREEWRAPAWFPRSIRFVVSPSPREEGDHPQLVTVLPGKAPQWIWPIYEIERIFRSLVVREIPWSQCEFIIDREPLAKRRAWYATERQQQTDWYMENLCRARDKSRRLDPVKREEANRRERERHRIARAERLSGRACPECGSAVTTRGGRGVTPIYCSERCNRRVANRNWWRRRHASERK